jgi:hypothetical protein
MVTEAAIDQAPLHFHGEWMPPGDIEVMPLAPSDGHLGYARVRANTSGKRGWAWVSPSAQMARRRLEASLKARGPGALFVKHAMMAYARHQDKNFPRLVAHTPRHTVCVGMDEAVGRVLDDLALVISAFTSGEIDPRWFLVHAAVRNTVLQLRGIDTYQEFIKRHQQAMERNEGT